MILNQRRPQPIRSNYHSHTTRCQHATGSDVQYVKAALENGYSHLGFSDHSPWPYPPGFTSRIRMPLNRFPDYLRSVSALKEEFKGQITLYTGLEAEYYPEYHAWLKEQREQHLDYLILGSHFDRPDEPLYFGSVTTKAQLYRYAKHTIKGMETGLFCCLAHPDLFMMNYSAFDKDCELVSRDICQAARELNLPLEYNLSGLYPQSWRLGAGYPAPGFWEVAAREKAPAIIGLDAHDPLRYQDTDVYDRAVGHLTGLGLDLVTNLLPC